MGSWFDDVLAASAAADGSRVEPSAAEAAWSIDWGRTPMGDPDVWPAGLRGAVELCLGTRFPAMVVWGTDLTMIYNDGYAEFLGPRHPGAMGRGVRDVWSEIWTDIEPFFQQVLTGRATWVADQKLLMTRLGYPEETYFTYSYSPLRDEQGRVAGVLDIATETTASVVGRRRLATVAELSRRLQAAASDVGAVGRVTVDLLGLDSPDVRAADVYLAQADDTPLLLATTRARASLAAVPEDVLRAVAGSGRAVVRPPTVVAPLGGAGGGEPVGVIVLESSPLRPFSTRSEAFLQLVAAAVSTAMEAAIRRADEIGELRRVSDTLQLSMLSGVTDIPRVATRYLPALGSLAVGGDWFDVLRPEDRRLALLVGDCVGHGLEAATVMGQLRSASRALLLDRVGAAATLGSLDRFAQSLDGAECTTVLCGLVDEDAGTLTYASAGHLPPLVISDGVARWLDGVVGLPLAVPHDGVWEERTVALLPGDTLVLFTDGLVERRGESLDAGLAELAERAEAFLRGPAEANDDHWGDLADTLLEGMLPHGARDDVALVVYHYAG